MSKKELIQLFGEQKVRTKWDDVPRGQVTDMLM